MPHVTALARPAAARRATLARRSPPSDLFRRMVAEGPPAGLRQGLLPLATAPQRSSRVDLADAASTGPAVKPRLDAVAADPQGRPAGAAWQPPARYGDYAETVASPRCSTTRAWTMVARADRPAGADRPGDGARAPHWTAAGAASRMIEPARRPAGGPRRCGGRRRAAAVRPQGRAGARARNASASLWDIGDGVACLEFHTKMNAIDDGTLELIEQTDRRRRRALRARWWSTTRARNFSVGANLGPSLTLANMAAWDRDRRRWSRRPERLRRHCKYAPFPVVGAPAGMALGGGCEVLLHCDAVQAHAETYMGLVEVGRRHRARLGRLQGDADPRPAETRRRAGRCRRSAKAFEMIRLARVSNSAAEARELLLPARRPTASP